MKQKFDNYIPLLVLIIFCASVALATYLALHATHEYTSQREAAPSEVNAGALPDRILTPGMVRIGVSKDELCNRSFRTIRIRNVTDSMKQTVRLRYHMNSKRDLWCNSEEGCEIDHLVPLLLGGANDISNLFPQAYQGYWNAHHKDRLEVRMKKLVCANQISLDEAQAIFMNNWIDGYKKYISPEPRGARRGVDEDFD
ncbi:MAG: HNH endonuclease [Verrucomicrobiaceae bacterium]|nr:MAG: HNH endonuclease [Verrucomicrobiaceae bacterium]